MHEKALSFILKIKYTKYKTVTEEIIVKTLDFKKWQERQLFYGGSFKPGSPLCKVVTRLLALLFPVAILLSITWMITGLEPFYEYQFARNEISNVTGIEQKDLTKVIVALSEYVVGQRDSMQVSVPIKGVLQPVYGDRELAHMVDVRAIFDGLRLFVVGYGVILTANLIWDRKRLFRRLDQLARYGVWGTLVIVISLGLLVIVDFTKYFYAFHEIFFTNDLWLLDPDTDVLIQMLPEVFFRDAALSILLLSIGLQWLFRLFTAQMLRLMRTKNNGLIKEDSLC